MNAHPWIRAEGIVKFPSRCTNEKQAPILNNCSLEIKTGGLTAIIGPSGAGKTSLLYCLGGLDQPDHGSVTINGIDLYKLNDEKRTRFLRENISFVFQDYNLINYLSVEDNVRLPHELAKKTVNSSDVDEMLFRFGLNEKKTAKVKTLSGGEQQRAALCRAILMRPSVIFADEPTGALDTANTDTVLHVLQDIAKNQCSVIMVTHDMESAALAEKIVFMRDGVIEHVTGRLGVNEIMRTMTRLGGE